MGRIEIFTDGGCHGNPGPGGWAFVATENGQPVNNSGAEKLTTNNRMELTAVIRALEYVESLGSRSESVSVCTDSQYVKNGITSWIHTWVRNGWMTSGKKPVKNKDLWVRLKQLNEIVKPEWRWVKGHAGNAGNEQCDRLVQQAIQSLT